MAETLSATAWIGTDPRSGADAPFLLLYTTDPARTKMAALAEGLRLKAGSMTRQTRGLAAELAGEHLTVLAGTEIVAERPLNADLATVAREYGAVVLVVGIDPVDDVGTVDRLDRYLSTRRTALGLAPLR